MTTADPLKYPLGLHYNENQMDILILNIQHMELFVQVITQHAV